MSFPDTTWPCKGTLSNNNISAEQKVITWDIEDYLIECSDYGDTAGESKIKVKSEDFYFTNVTLNLFASFHGQEIDSLFGINITSFIHADLYCFCKISFKVIRDQVLENIMCKFECRADELSHWAVKDFLTSSKLEEFLVYGKEIICHISIKELHSETLTTLSTKRSFKDAFDQAKSKDVEKPKMSPSKKVCYDFKQLLMSGESSDVIIQVQDQQFRAHWLILTARSRVFASMFRHDTKEKATGIVNVGDCEPSAFSVLLDYLYCGSIENLSIENVFKVYTTADKYDVQDLKLYCLEFIKNNLSVETFCETVYLCLLHSETDLFKVCVDFFARNMKKILITAKWQAFILENPLQSNNILTKASDALAYLPI